MLNRADATHRAAEEGFTLVEVLVALAVLAAGLTAILSTLSSGIFHQTRARTLAEATLGAETILARLGADLPLNTGITEGALGDGLRWRMEIAPYGDSADRQAWPVSAYAVTLTVQEGAAPATPLISLATLRLGPKE